MFKRFVNTITIISFLLLALGVVLAITENELEFIWYCLIPFSMSVVAILLVNYVIYNKLTIWHKS